MKLDLSNAWSVEADRDMADPKKLFLSKVSCPNSWARSLSWSDPGCRGGLLMGVDTVLGGEEGEMGVGEEWTFSCRLCKHQTALTRKEKIIQKVTFSVHSRKNVKHKQSYSYGLYYNNIFCVLPMCLCSIETTTELWFSLKERFCY